MAIESMRWALLYSRCCPEASELLNENLPAYELQQKGACDGVITYISIAMFSNGNSIFPPAAGYRLGTSVYYQGSNGWSWSGTLSVSYS